MRLATIDLGSNSFHLLIADYSAGELTPIAREKQKVQLRSGLLGDGALDQAAQERALACFEKFAKVLDKYKPEKVKVVGTYTLRSASHIGDFLDKAKVVLGYSIDVISGEEEARLIYVGVSSQVEDKNVNCLVVDIGGGSTELVIGQGAEISKAVSLNMGCVSFQEQFFEDGLLNQSNFDAAVVGAKGNLSTVSDAYLELGWSVCIGSSGTIQAISSVLEAEYGDDVITHERLTHLKDKLIELNVVDNIHLPGLRSDRENILAGGLSILLAVFEALKIESMKMSRAAIREGVMVELIQA